MEDLIFELVKVIKELSPEIWVIYKRQVYVHTVISGLLAFLFLLFPVIAFGMCKWKREWFFENRYSNNNKEELSPTGGLSLLFSGLFVILAIMLILFTISHLMNPDYYVVQLLLGR